MYDIWITSGKPYEIHRVLEKTYSLKADHEIFTRNEYIRSDVNVQIFYKGVSIEFHEIGTLKDFETILNREGFLEKRYDGIIYPRQGYLVTMKKDV